MLNTKKNKKQTELDNVTNAIADGIYNETIKQRVQILQGELDEIDTKIVATQNKAAARITKERIEKYITKILAGNKEMVLRHLVRKVVVYKEKVVIYYNVSEDGEWDTKPRHSRGKRAKKGENCLINENEGQRLVSPRISVAGAVRIELTSKGSESFVLPLHYAPIWVLVAYITAVLLRAAVILYIPTAFGFGRITAVLLGTAVVSNISTPYGFGGL